MAETSQMWLKTLLYTNKKFNKLPVAQMQKGTMDQL